MGVGLFLLPLRSGMGMGNPIPMGWGWGRLMSRACQGSLGRAASEEEPLEFVIFLNKDVTSLNCLLESASC